MNPKIKQMNAWKKFLRAKGVKVPRGMKYDQLRALYDKHDGPNRSRKPRGKASGNASKSKSSRRSRKSSASARTAKSSLFGWSHVL